MFWKENWLGETCLQTKFNWLFQFDQDKDAKVSDRVTWVNGNCEFNWQWCREPSGRTMAELSTLIELLNRYPLGSGNDSVPWKWQMAANGVFTTKKLNNIIMEKVYACEKSQPETMRNYLVPKKVEVFIWRARKKRLPTLSELYKTGVDLHSVRCHICDNDVESNEHALIFCNLAFDVWSRVYKWWGFGQYVYMSITKTFAGIVNQSNSELGANIWRAVEWTCGYILWKNRNSKIFKNKNSCAPSLLNEIQILSFDWISKRLKDPKIEWCSCLSNPQIYLFNSSFCYLSIIGLDLFFAR
ncbi:uncharacterized protein [Rutidosis leptorrhynchoides]|uniref:uncharacterized protein n=1 Tax=Rutidosis leptorrhynchoides TaxID=125765 RepID=UPI003A9952B9